MTKNELKMKWGKYADTDKLVDDVMCLLTKYNHRNSEHGVCRVLDEFFTNKEPLINLLQKSEHYAGDLRIVLDEQIERRTNGWDVRNCVDNFSTTVQAPAFIKKRIDSNNKTMGDYFRVGKQKVTLTDLDDTTFIASAADRSSALDAFEDDGCTKESANKYREFMSAMRQFRNITSSTMSDENVANLKVYKISSGTKTSRAFNKVCNHFAVDKSPMYNKEFAKYADMVSGLKRQIKFFISANPLDYLTMSFGVNWASCHTIDKQNVRRMENSYSGMYCGGTMSYMLDSTSLVTYVHNTMPENYETGKVYRNMFHFGGDGVLLQSRIYPQGNDGCTDLYKEFRYIMQREFTQILGLGANKWTKKGSVSNIDSIGVHYRDYDRNSSCNISYPSERTQCQHQGMTVGNHRLCFHCGRRLEGSSGSLSHGSCSIY